MRFKQVRIFCVLDTSKEGPKQKPRADMVILLHKNSLRIQDPSGSPFRYL